MRRRGAFVAILFGNVLGCLPAEVDAIVASPYFPAERAEKDVFRNYLLRLAAFRGGVKRDKFKFFLNIRRLVNIHLIGEQRL